MTNAARGEVALKSRDGVSYTLCLTLGAMAEIEEGLEIDDLTELGTRFSNMKVKDLLIILKALIHGGGQEGFSDKEFMAIPFEMKEVMAAVKGCFAAAGLSEEGDEEEQEPAEK